MKSALQIRRLTLAGLALAFVLGGAEVLSKPVQAGDDELLIFISAFAPGDQGAVHACRLDLQTGALRHVHRTGGVEHPFFLALSPDRRFLYSIDAPGQFGGKDHEFVAAFRLEGETGRMTLLNGESTHGTASCFLDVDSSGKVVLVANYATGSVASLPVRADGSLGAAVSFVQHSGSSVNEARQAGPHAHCILMSPNNRYAYAADLGTDQILIYRLDTSSAELSPAPVPFVRTVAGNGPRHLTFHPNGRLLYAINELANSITVFNHHPETGVLAEKQTISTLPTDYQGISYCADLKVTPDGKFLYGTNRGHDSIAAYRINDDGSLTLIEIVTSFGKGPQNLAITPDGHFLLCANMPGNNVVVFRISPESGRLQAVGDPLATISPSCIRIY